MGSSNNIQKEGMLQNEGSTSLNDSCGIGNRMNEYYERNVGGNEFIPNSVEDNDYWARLDKLLNTKFESFENKLTSDILEEVQKITEPIKKDIRDLTSENLKLRGDAQKSEEEIKLLKLKVDVLE